MKRGLALLGLLTLGCAVFQQSALISWKRATEQLRGLEFERRVHFRHLQRSELPAVIREIMAAAYPPGHVDDYAQAYAAIGALPAGVDLEASLLDLQQDQLLGLYDPQTETLYVITGGGRDRDYTAATMIHELVHALQHQHFEPLFAVQQGLRHNDDLVSGLTAAIEGDASLTMLARLPRRDRSVWMADQLRELMLLDIKYPQGKLAEAPRLLRASLLFGYTHGTPLAARYYAQAGNVGLDAMLRAPPISTRQARDLGDFSAVDFVALPLERLAGELAARDCELGHHNVAGALTIGVIFEDHEGEARRPGLDELLEDWRGDRFVHARCGEQWEFAWLTRWRSPAAAGAFATRYADIAESVAAAAPLSGPPALTHVSRTVLVHTPGLTPDLGYLIDESEIRSYSSLAAWLADDCFTESPCPRP